MVRKAKSNHYQILLTESSRDPKQFWNNLKRIFPTKNARSCMKSFFMDRSLTSCPITIASSFCTFFTNIVRHAKQNSILLKNFIWFRPVVSHQKTYATFRLKEVLVLDCPWSLQTFSRNKATGHDNLPLGLLKDSAQYIAGPLTHIINLSINQMTGKNEQIWLVKKRAINR